MAQETIANKTPMSHGLANDIAEIETETGSDLIDETQVETPKVGVQTDQFTKQFAELEKQAQERIAQEAVSGNLRVVQPKTLDETFDDFLTPDTLPAAEQAMIQDTAAELTQFVTGGVERPVFITVVPQEEFDEFKNQVVRAFKELGLDTRKFF